MNIGIVSIKKIIEPKVVDSESDPLAFAQSNQTVPVITQKRSSLRERIVRDHVMVLYHEEENKNEGLAYRFELILLGSGGGQQIATISSKWFTIILNLSTARLGSN
ncbi:hypothetical protein LPTSP4_00050 [Leptospira ryugenii]|uniref:Uncharacterized protein n=1 Tax=Leptospira ryugenii TaxID=1917863 RepID=A0A2P2DV41_9LEPT|nr:hypothetical protein LPTSP4_00050 [Leptospira ryugenii]